jgi:type II secretory pathway pseudopilin PulG
MLELMAIVVTLGIVSSLALPLYVGYEHTALMQKANFHYREAVRIATRGYAEDAITVAYGTTIERPRDAQGWIQLFSRGNPVAPGGGPAFVEGEAGSAATGAIGVSAADGRVTLVRPAYLELTAHRATIVGDAITYSPASG